MPTLTHPTTGATVTVTEGQVPALTNRGWETVTPKADKPKGKAKPKTAKADETEEQS